MSRSGRLTRAIALGVLLSLGCLGFTPSPTLAEHRSIATVDSSVNESPVALGSLLTLFSAPSVAEISESRRREMPQASGPDVDGRVTTMMTDGDLTMRVELTPRALGRSDYAVRLERSDGQPYTGVARVAFKFAMIGMDHGLFSQEGIPGDDGQYAAQGNDLIMAGAWYGWVLVELDDGTLRGGQYAFGSGPERPALVVGRVESGSPPGVRLVNVAVYADEPPPLTAIGAIDAPTLVEIALAQSNACDGSVRLPALGLEVPFTDHGLAQVRIPPMEPQMVQIRCTPLGLLVE
ncbi:MAG: hypothetical protein U0893_03890 [Chloroflexota bacterium]